MVSDHLSYRDVAANRDTRLCISEIPVFLVFSVNQHKVSFSR
jgi:hypothetical protein